MIKWGIIGLGNIANIFAEAIKETNNAKLQSISSLDKNRLDIFKNKFEIDKQNCHSNYISVIENDTVDIIYIALPNSLHYKWILNCIKSNKNILVEKPATINIKEILEINKLLDSKNIFFC
ncbi:MAG: gfo/Idh/MocA family oxidoreductase [Candidatus Pelagibacter sp. TMED118]|nr:MAG: gfo/Idh/MocA family oxidoreductase [Candidatus Pelagibacter sp. TMED118]